MDQILRRTRSYWKDGYIHLGFWTWVVPNDTLKAATLPKVYLAPHCLETHKERVPALSVPPPASPRSTAARATNGTSCALPQPISTGFSAGWGLHICHADEPWIAGENDGGERNRGCSEILLCLVPGAGPTSTRSAMVVSLKIYSVLKICSLVPLALSLPWNPQQCSCLSPLWWLLWQRLLLVWKCKSALFTKALVARILWD